MRLKETHDEGLDHRRNVRLIFEGYVKTYGEEDKENMITICLLLMCIIVKIH